MPDHNLQRPIFVVGVPRSGTTLLSAILDQHPRIAVGPESHFLSYWARAFSRWSSSRPANFPLFWSSFTSSRHFPRWEVAPSAIRDLLHDKTRPTFRDVFAALLEAYRTHRGKDRVGEKTPDHYQYVERLLTWFSDARIVYVVRDPRAVVASLIRAPWGERTVLPHAIHWQRSVRRALLRRDPRVTVVHYESLVSQPEETLALLCRFLGEPFDKALLHTDRVGGPLAGAEEWKDAARGPIRADFVDKWRDHLTSGDLAIVEQVTGRWMVQAGYEREERPIRLGRRLVLSAKALIHRVERRISQLVRPRPPWSLRAGPKQGEAEPEP